MSWFGSIVNSLKLDDDDDAVSQPGDHDEPLRAVNDDDALQSSEGQSGRGVKGDLDEITKTLTRQFWGVASFLAPPPQSPTKDDSVSESDAAAAGIDGIRTDFAEIGGRFKSGITKLSGAKAVSEFSKIASNILQFGLDQGSVGEYESGSAIGVTEEVLAFVKNISSHPDTWLDFPLVDDDDQEQDDFDMSDAQQEHALAVERLVPELAALRFELCPEYMTEGFFWKIYFVLVHPRLDKHDADLISTPQILETRAILTQKLQSRRETAVEQDGSYREEVGASSHEIPLTVPCSAPTEVVRSSSSHSSPLESAAFKPLTPDTDNQASSFKDIQMVDNSVITEGPKTLPEAQISSPALPSSSHHDTDDDGDDWLKEEPTEAGTANSSGINIPNANDEDVSFSDLEEEDDTTDVPASAKKTTYVSDSSTKSPDWVQLSRSSSDSPKAQKLSDVKNSSSPSPNKESNEWLKFEDIDEM